MATTKDEKYQQMRIEYEDAMEEFLLNHGNLFQEFKEEFMERFNQGDKELKDWKDWFRQRED